MDSNVLESLGRPLTLQESSDFFVRIENDLVLKNRNDVLRAPSYLCLVCGKGLSITTSLSGVRMHVKTHSGEKPYLCKFCNKGLSTARDLAKHIKVIHEAFKCDVCNRKFVRKDDLLRHIRSHTGEKPFSCTYCNKAFNRCGHKCNFNLLFVAIKWVCVLEPSYN